ncbi:putative Citrate transporter-like domain-containing protein [Seiridium unicorne]|uniref:Citrate transporter-like domain-containing protein n=1 Tax=Seiridium unicorne TaxID=138068 RepID=A0ABR2UQJ4_9PEZI
MAQDVDEADLDTSIIRDWRSIVTLIVFVLTNVNVLFPYHVPIYVPRVLVNAGLDTLSSLRIIPPRQDDSLDHSGGGHSAKVTPFVRFRFPMNFLTAPLVADLFLLAILAIGREEVYGGTIEANNIKPYDIMIFFISLAYIAISLDASGLIRWLAFKVLQKGGSAGHRLFLYLYAFFFVLGSFIGNDPIILSGTAFLAYMTRVSSNIVHPRAWIHAQFAIANIASAILVSSNPTNLVLAGAFKVQFLTYTANMIVPVIATAIVLFPFLLYIVFNDEKFIPSKINMHELPDEVKARKPVNPNIPHARGMAEEEENRHVNDEQGKLLSLEEIMNPFLDKGGAAFGALIMAATLVTLIGLNASGHEWPIFYVTLPAAAVMLFWDIGFGWINRHETRKISRDGRREVELARADRARLEEEARRIELSQQQHEDGKDQAARLSLIKNDSPADQLSSDSQVPDLSASNTDNEFASRNEKDETTLQDGLRQRQGLFTAGPQGQEATRDNSKESEKEISIGKSTIPGTRDRHGQHSRTLTSILADRYRWSQETFPTVTVVVSHLPFALIPFAFCMFTLVQALVTKGWIAVFAYGWDHWVTKTGTVGAVGGMGFLSVILCNFAGTNIGTTILLSRVIQAWVAINDISGRTISERTFWATVYAMALGVNYGAFSTAFSASLAGLLWRDILARKHIRVKSLDFARSWAGFAIFDLGCGMGWFSHWARENGAAYARGIDLSENMLGKARNNAYDLVFSSLAFHYLVNLPGLFKEIHKSLKPGGKLVFSIEHPIFTGPTRGGFISDAAGRKIWPLDAYQKEELRLRN